jgi:hypothetical protein
LKAAAALSSVVAISHRRLLAAPTSSASGLAGLPGKFDFWTMGFPQYTPYIWAG